MRRPGKAEAEPTLEDALGSVLAFGIRYLPHLYRLKPAPMHSEWDAIAMNPEITRSNKQAHRESAKTTFWAITVPLYRIAIWSWMRREGNPDIDEHIAIFCWDMADAKARVRQIRREIETNVRLREDFGIKPSRNKQRVWGDAQFIVDGARDVKNPTVYASGVGGTTPGTRLTCAILDDTTHPLHVQSRIQREKQLHLVEEVVEPSMLEGAPIYAIHTTFHNADLPNTLAKRPDTWHSQKWPLIIDEEQKRVQWPEAFPWERVVDLKQKPLVFARQYQLREVLMEERLLPMPEDWDIRRLEMKAGAFFIDGERVRTVIGVDPAMTESELNRGSRTAIVVGLVKPTKHVFIPWIRVGRWGPDRVMEEIAKAHIQWKAERTWIEKQAFGAAYQKMLNKRGIPALPSDAVGDKMRRIVGTLNPYMSTHMVYILSASDQADNQVAEGWVELQDFPGDTIDIADAMEHLIRNVNSDPVFAATPPKKTLISHVQHHTGQRARWIPKYD